MKNIFILLFISIAGIATAQFSIGNDAALSGLQSQLPIGWVMSISGNMLSIERTDSVMTLYANHINEPPKLPDYKKPSDEERKILFEKNGSKTKFVIVFKLEPKWDNGKIEQANKHNDSINTSIKSLWYKYGIEKFYHRAEITTGKHFDEDRFEPKTKEDSLSLGNYKSEKAQFEKSLILMPDKCSYNYSLFTSGQSCYEQTYFNHSFSDIYPESANDELWKVCEAINKYCDCSK
jgi:hypothetical protein